MAEFKTANLGDIMQTAQTIQGLRQQQQSNRIRDEYLGQRAQNEQADRASADATEDARKHFILADAIEKSDDPVNLTKQFAPDLIQAFEQQHGQGSFAQVTPEALKQTAGMIKQKYASDAGIMPQAAPGVSGAMYRVIGEDGKPMYTDARGAMGKQPFFEPKAPRGSTPGAAPSGFADPQIQALQASMVAAGFAPPAGFRSKDQQLSMYQGLLKKYDGLSTDDIAHLAASNSIDFKSVSKATQAAATMGGRVEVANNELRGFIPIAKDASAAMDRGAFVPYNRLKQAGQASISDPDLKRLFVATQTVLNAYDVLAARGGTDKDKRAENHRILENADSPEAYNAALDMITREASAAGVATQNAMKAGAFGYPTGQQATDAPANQSQRLSPEEAAKLPSGTHFIGEDGTPRVRH